MNILLKARLNPFRLIRLARFRYWNRPLGQGHMRSEVRRIGDKHITMSFWFEADDVR